MSSKQPDADLGIERRVEGRHVRLALTGELDLATAPLLRSALEAERRAQSRVVLDIDSLAFMDSSGLRELVLADRESRRDGWEFAVTPGRGAVRRILELSGLDAVLTFRA